MNKLKDFLQEYNKDDLIFYAKELGIGRISGLRKAELANRIAEFLLNPEIMKRRLSILTDAQMKLFEKGIEKSYKPREVELEDVYMLRDLDYSVLTIEGLLFIPSEIKSVYKSINSPLFQEYRKQTSWLMQCLVVQNAFYGYAHSDLIYDMYQSRPKYKIGKKAMIDLFNKIPIDLNESFLAGDMIVAYLFRDIKNLQVLKNIQEGKPYYRPTYREILDYNKNGYLSEDPYYEELSAYFMKIGKFTYTESQEYSYEVWHKFDQNEALTEVIDWLTQHVGLVFNSEEEFGHLVKLLQEANNNTRMLTNRGHKPNEIASQTTHARYPTLVPGSTMAAEMLKQAMPDLGKIGVKVDLNAGAAEIPVLKYPKGLNSEAIISTKKIYPNDPCPCGSGRKYKKCCASKV